jgi:hypothetical protein
MKWWFGLVRFLRFGKNLWFGSVRFGKCPVRSTTTAGNLFFLKNLPQSLRQVNLPSHEHDINLTRVQVAHRLDSDHPAGGRRALGHFVVPVSHELRADDLERD